MDDQIIRLKVIVDEVMVQLIWEELVTGKPFDKAVESAKEKARGYITEFLNVPTEQLVAQKQSAQKVETP